MGHGSGALGEGKEPTAWGDAYQVSGTLETREEKFLFHRKKFLKGFKILNF